METHTTTATAYVLPQTPQEWEDDGYADGIAWGDSSLSCIHERIARTAGKLQPGAPTLPYLIGLLKGLAQAAQDKAAA